MREEVPLATIHEAVLEFLSGRDDAVVFGAQAVNAYCLHNITVVPKRERSTTGEMHEQIFDPTSIAKLDSDVGGVDYVGKNKSQSQVLRPRPVFQFVRLSLQKSSRLVSERLFIHLQHRQKRFLRNLYAADFLHPLLAFFLFFEQFAFARDVAAVAFGDDVFAHGFDGFAGDDFRADGGLNGDLKHLPRDQFLHFCRQRPAFAAAVSR